MTFNDDVCEAEAGDLARGELVRNGGAHPDLDKTLVNIEQYLQEEADEPVVPMTRRGEGDMYGKSKIEGNKSNSALYSARAGKKVQR